MDLTSKMREMEIYIKSIESPRVLSPSTTRSDLVDILIKNGFELDSEIPEEKKFFYSHDSVPDILLCKHTFDLCGVHLIYNNFTPGELGLFITKAVRVFSQ